MARKKENGEKPGFPAAESYTLTDLEQVKVLADPLRVRLLEAFCVERTTKQVADRLGEKSTKLYHHVEALEKVGLIRRTRTRQNRGTLEKYYQAVARTFRADARLFLSDEQESPQTDALQTVMSTMLDRVARELGAIIEAGQAAPGLDQEGVVAHCEVRGSDAEMTKLRRRLDRLVKSVADDACGDESLDDLRRYRLMLMFYPLDWKDRSKE